MESLRLVFSIDLLSLAIGSPHFGDLESLPKPGVDPPHLGVYNIGVGLLPQSEKYLGVSKPDVCLYL
jgi:hypothetical protein